MPAKGGRKKKEEPVVQSEPVFTETEQNDEVKTLREDLVAAFEFAANELKPMFGQGALAMVFDAIAKGLRK